MIIAQEKELLELLKRLRESGKSVVFTNGCFDILHAGHASYLKKAKSFGDFLIVGINSDLSIKKIKGDKRPILPLNLRAYLLDSLKPVDAVVPFDEETPKKLIELIKPDVLVKGADWEIDKIVGREFAKEVKRVPFEFEVSTTSIIDRIVSLYCGRTKNV